MRIVGASIIVVAVALPPVAEMRPQGPALRSDGASLPTAVIAGQAVEATTNRGVGGAVVTLIAGTPPSGAPAPATARRGVVVASNDGRFVFRDVPAGEYTITAARNGYAPGATGRWRPEGPGRPIVIAADSAPRPVTIPMWRLASISGQVLDDLGDPMVAIPVWAMRSTISAGRQVLVLGSVESTDDRGRYRISSLMPGDYAVAIRNATRSAAVSSVQAYNASAAAGTSATIMSHWLESGALRPSGVGPVVDGWQIQHQDTSGTPIPVSGPDGRLLVHPSAFFAGAAHPADATIVTLAAGEERQGIDFALALTPGARVSGTLVGPTGPTPHTAVRLLPRDRDGPMVPLGGDMAVATTDEAGRFALLGVPSGAYVLRAHRIPRTMSTRMPMPPQAGAPRGVTRVETLPSATDPDAPTLFAEQPVVVTGADVDDLTLTLVPGARLSGRVEFEGTPPAPKALQQIAISPMQLGGSVSGVSASRVDANGSFTTRGYPPGRYLLDATGPGGTWTLVSARIGGAEALVQPFALGTRDVEGIVLTFTDRVTGITGTVRATGRDAPPDATVVAFPADHEAWRAAGMPMRQVVTAQTTADGAYRLPIEIPGEYVLVAIPPEVAPDPDAAFLSRYAPRGVRVSIGLGEQKVQPLTLESAR